MYPDKDDFVKGIFVERIVNQLRQADFSVEVVALSNSNLPAIVRYCKFYCLTFWQLLTRDYDLAYVHYASHSALPVLLARLFRAASPLITHVHGSDVFPEDNTKAWVKYLKVMLSSGLIKHSKRVIVPSPYFYNKMLDRYSVAKHKLHISPSGGVDTEVFYPKDTTLCRSSPTNIIGFAGRLTADKGLLDFHAALLSLRSKGLNVEGHIAGDGPHKQSVIQWQCNGEVKYLGSLKQHDLAEFYRSLNVFVFPTRRESESLGLVGLEAMACGTPVVAYSGSGPETYISPGQNGFLVTIGDIDGLADAIKKVIDLPYIEYEAMSYSAKSSVKMFSSVDVGAHLIDFIRSEI